MQLMVIADFQGKLEFPTYNIILFDGPNFFCFLNSQFLWNFFYILLFELDTYELC